MKSGRRSWATQKKLPWAPAQAPQVASSPPSPRPIPHVLQVPGVLLVCRNSTDANYFQRLRPYPRVLLGRKCALFKDYAKSPNGFGIAVVMLAKQDRADLYERFYDAFADFGEPSIPIDRQLLQSPEFAALLGRLRDYAAEHHREHWARCTVCERWRIVDYAQAKRIETEDIRWQCAMLRPGSSCSDPLTRRERQGDKYAPGETEKAPVLRADSTAGSVADTVEGGQRAGTPSSLTAQTPPRSPPCEAPHTPEPTSAAV